MGFMILLFNILFLQTSYAWNVDSYEQREKSFEAWVAAQEKSKITRQNAAEKHREARLLQTLKKIRSRLQFKREYRTTSHLEEAYLKSLVGQEEYLSQRRESFAKQHKTILDYYEKNMVPLKKKEYGLEDLETLSPKESENSADE